MTSYLQFGSRRFFHQSPLLAIAGILVFLTACQQPAANSIIAAGSPPTPRASSTTLALAPAANPVPLKILTTTPETGYVGTAITLSGQGLAAGKKAQIVWGTVDGSYVLHQSSENVEYDDRKFVEKRVTVGETVVDATGHLSASFNAPEDYGEIHDIYAVVDGQDVAKGGFVVQRNVTMTPQEGAVGTPITISVKGLGSSPFANTLAVMYDNQYVGFVSAVTTRGTATARLRAAGPPGMHTIRVTDASGAVPYLNAEQSPRKLPQFRFTFNVTSDAGSPAPSFDWPAASAVASLASIRKTTEGSVAPTPGVSATLSPSSGPIQAATTLQATGLPPNTTLDLVWMSVKGNRVSPSGWNLITIPLGQKTTNAEGALTSDIAIPDDLGGWHMVDLVQGQKVLAEVPFFIERSFVTVTPAQVKAGEQFTVQLKGVGWTELDNAVAVTYDNAYIGYACGFNSQGDVTMYLTASGQPGTHLVDLYPTIYEGHGKGPWDYDLPQLSFAQDQPGLSIGYRVPAIRLAIQVMP